MPSPREVIYVDTNVVLEAQRTGCLLDILERFDVRTVEMVRIEIQTGDQRREGYVTVDMEEFSAKTTINRVTDVQLLQAASRAPSLPALDPGERDLLALVASENPRSLLLTTADKAAVKTACQLGLGDRLISLEEIAGQCGKNPALKKHYSKAWLGQVRAEFLFDTL